MSGPPTPGSPGTDRGPNHDSGVTGRSDRGSSTSRLRRLAVLHPEKSVATRRHAGVQAQRHTQKGTHRHTQRQRHTPGHRHTNTKAHRRDTQAHRSTRTYAQRYTQHTRVQTQAQRYIDTEAQKYTYVHIHRHRSAHTYTDTKAHRDTQRHRSTRTHRHRGTQKHTYAHIETHRGTHRNTHTRTQTRVSTLTYTRTDTTNTETHGHQKEGLLCPTDLTGSVVLTVGSSLGVTPGTPVDWGERGGVGGLHPDPPARSRDQTDPRIGLVSLRSPKQDQTGEGSPSFYGPVRPLIQCVGVETSGGGSLVSEVSGSGPSTSSPCPVTGTLLVHWTSDGPDEKRHRQRVTPGLSLPVPSPDYRSSRKTRNGSRGTPSRRGSTGRVSSPGRVCCRRPDVEATDPGAFTPTSGDGPLPAGTSHSARDRTPTARLVRGESRDVGLGPGGSGLPVGTGGWFDDRQEGGTPLSLVPLTAFLCL